jgi:hypothetical protein
MEEITMAIAIQVKPALREALRTPEAEAALIDLLNQFHAEQRNGFERSLEMHLQAIKEYLGHHLAEADAKNEKRFGEIVVMIEKRFAEADVKMERRLGEYHRSLLRWLFTFFIGTVLTLLGFLLTFLQLAKP